MEYESNVVNTTFTVIVRLDRMSSFFERYSEPIPGWRDSVRARNAISLLEFEQLKDVPLLVRDDRVVLPDEIATVTVLSAELRVGKQGILRSKQVSASGLVLSETSDTDSDRGLPNECVVRALATTNSKVSANLVFTWCTDKENGEGGYLKMNGVLPLADLMASRVPGVDIDDHVRTFFRKLALLYAEDDNIIDISTHLMNFQYGVRCVFNQPELLLFFEAVKNGEEGLPVTGIRPTDAEWREESVTFKNRHYHKSVRVTLAKSVSDGEEPGTLPKESKTLHKVGTLMISEMGVIQIWGVQTMRQMFEIMQFAHVSIGWAVASPEWSQRVTKDYRSQETRVIKKRARAEKTQRAKKNLRLALSGSRAFKTNKGRSVSYAKGTVVSVPYCKWRVRDLREELAARGLSTSGLTKQQMFRILAERCPGVEMDSGNPDNDDIVCSEPKTELVD